MPVRYSAIAQYLTRSASWIAAILLAVHLGSACAQENPTPSAPTPLPPQSEVRAQIIALNKPVAPFPSTVSDNLGLRAGYGCGGGASTSSVATQPTTQCGALIGLGFLETEVGIMGPQANRSQVSAYLSENLWVPLHRRSEQGSPVAVGGYTRMFETGHAVDYGLAYVKPIGRLGEMRYVQFEARDYWTFANPNQHNVVFRVIWLFGAGDEP